MLSHGMQWEAVPYRKPSRERCRKGCGTVDQICRTRQSVCAICPRQTVSLGHDVRQDKETALHWLSAAAAQGNIYAKYLLERMDSFKDPSILLAATRLMHHLGNIFREEYQKAFGNPLIQVDRKLRKNSWRKTGARSRI